MEADDKPGTDPLVHAATTLICSIKDDLPLVKMQKHVQQSALSIPLF